jgi:hypothetical protein
MPRKQYPAMRCGAQEGNSSNATEAPTIGAEILIQNQHRASLAETKRSRIKISTIKGHCNKLKTIIEWIKTNYPEYADAGGIIQLSEEELQDPKKIYHKNPLLNVF